MRMYTIPCIEYMNTVQWSNPVVYCTVVVQDKYILLCVVWQDAGFCLCILTYSDVMITLY